MLPEIVAVASIWLAPAADILKASRRETAIPLALVSADAGETTPRVGSRLVKAITALGIGAPVEFFRVARTVSGAPAVRAVVTAPLLSSKTKLKLTVAPPTAKDADAVGGGVVLPEIVAVAST